MHLSEVYISYTGREVEFQSEDNDYTVLYFNLYS
jgi:hypothetical protein